MKRNGKHIDLELELEGIIGEELADDIGLHKFLRKVYPELWDLMRPYAERLERGDKITVPEWIGMIETWREVISFMWAAHSPRQQPAFEEKIKETWQEVRRVREWIGEKCEAELERRKALS
jgi:hypothetical protein